MNRMRVVDLFCGAGGWSRGFFDEGFDVALGVDFWDRATATYAKAYGAATITKDVLAVTPKEIVDAAGGWPDVVIGGPPCTEFSTMNRNPDRAEGVRTLLKFIEIVEAVEPRFYVGENVQQVLTHYSALNGKVEFVKVLVSADFGSAQLRERAFWGRYPAPERTNVPGGTTTLSGAKLGRWKTLGEAIAGLGEPNGDSSFGHVRTPNDDKVYESWLQSQREITLWGQVPTVLPVGNSNPIVKELGRRLTPREMARVQGFPDSHIFTGSVDDQGLQVGNAVDACVSRAFARAIKAGWGK